MDLIGKLNGKNSCTIGNNCKITGNVNQVTSDTNNDTNNGWISVDDRLPTERDVYTVYCPDSLYFQHEKEQIQMASFNPDTGWNSHARITHWQLLPQPPK